MTGVQGEQGFSIYRLRWVGYGLLVLSLLDIIATFTPPNFLNPVWELQTIGALVERVPVPLLGLALIFFGEDYDRSEKEDLVLKFLSWLCLLLALVFVLMIPLGIVNTLKINNQNNQQITQQAGQQLSQLKQVEERLTKGSPEDLKNLANELTRLGVQANTQNPEELKKQILSRIDPAKQQLENQSKAVQSNQRLVLLKNSVKWILGALISSVLFFTIWKGTDWAR
ncbi:MAG TPA: HpsJ family protein [Kamptonema sp.]|nr:HpsJ family protein [Kamptonema sp.]